MDGGAVGHADEIVQMQVDEQTAIRSALLIHQLWIPLGRIVPDKFCRELIDRNFKFHILPLSQKTGPAFQLTPPERFARSIFILPMCQNRHTSSSLGQFLFYRRVRTVTRLLQRRRNCPAAFSHLYYIMFFTKVQCFFSSAAAGRGR